MNQDQSTLLIAALALILPPTLGYIYAKKQATEDEKRLIKQGYYRNYIESFSFITDGEINHANSVKHAKASNDLYVVASPDVIFALQAYQDSQTSKSSNEVINQRISDLVKSMRADLGVNNNQGWEVKLWTAGKRKIVSKKKS